MAGSNALRQLRVGWWAGHEPQSPLASLAGSLLRAEMTSRCPWSRPLLVLGSPASWAAPGFTGEPAVAQPAGEWAASGRAPVDLLVASGEPEPGGLKLANALAEEGIPTLPVASEASWGLEPRLSVGAPFGMPEPSVLVARRFDRKLLDARLAYLRVVEGLPASYILVEGALFETYELTGTADLEMALSRLSEEAAGETRPEVVRLAPGPLGEDAEVEGVLRERRAEVEEGRYQAEDWLEHQVRARLPLRVTSGLDLAAAVAGASAVVAGSGALMAMAWALGAPHVAIAPEESPARDFSAWTGDTSSVAGTPTEMVATIGNIFARRGAPYGLRRVEATLDQALDEAAATLEKSAATLEKSTSVTGASAGRYNARVSPEERARELESANEALRLRLAAERLHFAQRSALLEKAAHTTVESAIKAVHGQDVIVRRRLEMTEKEMHRLQEETAVQQAELRAIYNTRTMKAIAPARELYKRFRGALR